MTVIQGPPPPAGPVGGTLPLSITLPAGSANLQSLAPGTVLLGTVEGRLAGQPTVIVTEDGGLRLPIPFQLAPGSTVTLRLEGTGPQVQLAILAVRAALPTPAAPAAAGSAASLDAATLLRRWPALDDANAALSGRLPIPRPGPQFAATMARLAMALRANDIELWLDRGTQRAVEAAAGGRTLVRLGEDFAALARLASRTEGEDGQVLVFPFLNGTDLRQARLRLGRRDPASSEPQGAHRFLLELDDGPYGWMQFDGLVGRSRFDLIVRTEHPMPSAQGRQLTTIFNAAIAAFGYAGAIEITVGSGPSGGEIGDIASGQRGLVV